MLVRVLGPIGARPSPGHDWVDPSPQQRAVLALLVARLRSTCRRDRLVQLVWGDRVPDNAPRLLQGLVSRLRGVLGPADHPGSRLLTVPDGWRLDLTDEQVDAALFERLVRNADELGDSGDREAARDGLEQALKLWRGRPFAELADHPMLAGERARLDEARVVARERLLEVRLAGGEHDVVAAELADLTAAHPLRERLHRLLMLALYRAGRQADALAVYEDIRVRLAEELGTDPGPELQALHTAILRQDVPAGPKGTGPTSRTPRQVLHRSSEAPSTLKSAAISPPGPRLTSFVGRGDELTMVTRLLQNNRLVSLVGTGGVGKTRLAEEVLAGIAAGGMEVAWVDLAPLEDSGLVADAMAAGLGVRPTLGASLLDSIATQVGDRKLVVGVDNAEHVVDGVVDVAVHVLPRCPELRMLVTSRQVLGVPAEVVAQVEPLSEDWAVALFEDRAALVTPAGPDPEAAVVRRICRRLDRLPLAIELAAARLRAMSAEQIADGLDDRFALLGGETRRGEPRQRTLEASVGWSYDLLDENGQRLLQILSVFAGPFTVDAVVEVGEGLISEPAVRNGVVDLVDRSLVAPAATALDVPRFRLLETVRAFGRRQLSSEHERAERVRGRHLSRCLRVVRDAHEGLHGDDWRRWLVVLDEESADILAAARYAEAGGDWGSAAELLGRVSEYWVRRPARHALVDRLTGLLRGRPIRTGGTAAAGFGAAQMLARLDRESEAREMCARVFTQADGVEDAEPAVLAAFGMWAWTCAGQQGVAHSWVDDTLRARVAERGDPVVHLYAARDLAIRHRIQGSLSEAVRLFDVAVDAIERTGCDIARGTVCVPAAAAAFLAADLSRAEELLDQTWPVLEPADLALWAIAHTVDGRVHALRGHTDTARGTPSAVRTLAADLWPDPDRLKRLLVELWADIAVRIGQGEQFSHDLDRKLGEPPTPRRCRYLTTAGLFRAEQGQPEDGLALVEDAAELNPEHALRRDRSAALLARGRLRLLAGHPEATDAAHIALARHLQTEQVFLPDAIEVAAGTEAYNRDDERAVRLLGAASRRRDDLGTVRLPIDRPWVDELATDLEHRLGAATFAHLWEEGAKLPFEEFIDQLT